MYAIQIVEGSFTLAGKYVLEYNPRLDDDETYLLTVVDEISEAKQFDTVNEAINYAAQECPNPPKFWMNGKEGYRPLIMAVQVNFVPVRP